jgi:pimeloyl-ACP methyl ester carboxylesterase
MKPGSWPAVATDPSDVPAGPTTVADHVADVSAVLSAMSGLASSGVHLVGASYGATIALHTALSNASKLKSLSLYEPPLFAAGHGLDSVLASYRARLASGEFAGADLVFLAEVARLPAPMLAAFAERADIPDEDEARRSALGKLHDLKAMAADSQDLDRRSTIALPVPLMQGADTRDPMPGTMDALAAQLEDVARVTWAGQMHFATSSPRACRWSSGAFSRTTGDWVRKLSIWSPVGVRS